VKGVTLCLSSILTLFFFFLSIFSSLIGSWVSVGMNARVKTKAAAHLLNFDQQCKHCEKVIMFYEI
jgi:hypothetical protein